MLNEIIGKWGYSTDDDDWNSDSWFDTKQEAIDEGKADYDDFFVGRAVAVKPIIDVEVLLDKVSESVYEECGENADDYLNDVDVNMRDELSNQLNEVFQSWLTKHQLHPNFYLVEDVENITT